MDLVDDKTSIVVEEEEDRISNLSNDVILHILSFLAMQYAIQTSKLSWRWKRVWTSMPNLNFNSCTFRTWSLFAKFVKKALSHRDNDIDVSSVELSLIGSATPSVVKKIVNYAYLHNVSQLTMKWFTRKIYWFPEYLFNSGTLKHLTLATSCQSFYIHGSRSIPKLAWDFPTLETLFLSNIRLGDAGDASLDLFSKCVNLKDLTLHMCCMYGLDIFYIRAPELSNLKIIDTLSFPNVFNVVAPKLSNLTASVKAIIDRVPILFDTLRLSTNGFDYLEKVNLSLSMPHYEQERFVPVLLNLFQRLCNAKFLVIDLDIIETLSLCPDQLSLERCPFDNLECLKIIMVSLKQKASMATIPTRVRNYLLANSPNATIIMDLPQVSQKRSTEHVHNETRAKKVAKLEVGKKQPKTIPGEKRMLKAKIQTQDKLIAEQKEKIQVLEAEKLQDAKLTSHIIKEKMEELQLQVESGNPDYEIIRLIGCQMKSFMDLIPESLRVVAEAQFFSQYKEFKSVFHNRVDASLWANIENALGNKMLSESARSNNIYSHSDVSAAKRTPARRPSSANMPASSSVACSGNNMTVQPSQSSRE